MIYPTAENLMGSLSAWCDKTPPSAGPAPPCAEGSDGDAPGPCDLLGEAMEYFEKGPGSESLLARELEISGEEISLTRTGGHRRREIIPGFGCALVVHFALLLAAHLFPLTPAPAAEPRYIVVSLAGLGDAGAGGEEGTSGGSGSAESASVSDPASVAAVDEPANGTESRVEVAQAPVPEELSREAPEIPPVASPEVPVKTIAQKDPAPAKKPPARAVKPKPDKIARASTKKEAAAARVPSEVPSAGTGTSGGEAHTGRDDAGTGRREGDGHGGPGDGGAGGPGSRGSGMPAEFTLQQVEHPPVVLRKVEPRFPENARRMGITGKVVVKFLVKADGHVSGVTILEARPSGLFEQSVLESLDKWLFKPGAHKGRAVATWVVQPIQFSLSR